MAEKRPFSQDEKMILALVATGFLSVDHAGNIWQHRRTFSSTETWREELIEPKRCDTGRKSGYLTVQVSFASVRYAAPAHRVAWMVHNRRMIPQGMEINHRDGNKGNNYPGNLEVVTRAENVVHALHVLGQQKLRRRKGNVLTPEQVLQIRALAGTMPRTEIAKRFSTTVVTVRKIVNRETWAWLQSTG